MIRRATWEFLITHDVDRPYSRKFGDLSVTVLGLAQISAVLAGSPGPAA